MVSMQKDKERTAGDGWLWGEARRNTWGLISCWQGTNHPPVQRLESTAKTSFLYLYAGVGVQDWGLFLCWNHNIRLQSSSKVVSFLMLVVSGDFSSPCESLQSRVSIRPGSFTPDQVIQGTKAGASVPFNVSLGSRSFSLSSLFTLYALETSCRFNPHSEAEFHVFMGNV